MDELQLNKCSGRRYESRYRKVQQGRIVRVTWHRLATSLLSGRQIAGADRAGVKLPALVTPLNSDNRYSTEGPQRLDTFPLFSLSGTLLIRYSSDDADDAVGIEI
jgi:hypothetical protein